MSEVWERRAAALAENKVVIELDDEEARALRRLLARYVISLGEECPTLTDLAVKL